MKKLVTSLLALATVATFSIQALEKSGEPSVDAETLRIEESRGERPQERLYYQHKLNQLNKENLSAEITRLKDEAKQKTGSALEKIKAKIREYEAAIKAKL